eukprot:jgi/Bigna1/139949/aug1.53_g14657
MSTQKPSKRVQQPSQRLQQQLTSDLVEKYLHENDILLRAIYEHQSQGKTNEASSYQMKLQQNLIYLATIADVDPRKKREERR